MARRNEHKLSRTIEAIQIPAIFLSTSAFAPAPPMPGKWNVVGSLIDVVPK